MINLIKPKTWNINENPFNVVIADLTHRCNMNCKNCYIPNRSIPDMDANKLIELAKLLPNRVELRLIGAEPTLRADLQDIIFRLTTETNHRVILLTNGLKLSDEQYTKSLKDAGLKYIYVSINGLDNDHWYKNIDGMNCSKYKLSALKNIVKYNFFLDTGCILVKGINNLAIKKMIPFLKTAGINKGVIRLKNVGQVGRYQLNSTQNFSLKEIASLCSQEWNLSLDDILNSKIINNGKEEFGSRFFSVDGSTNRAKGLWCKITDWSYISSQGETSRRGRITQDWKIAEFSEHIKYHEGQY